MVRCFYILGAPFITCLQVRKRKGHDCRRSPFRLSSPSAEDMTISGYETYILLVSNLQGAEYPDEEKDETNNPNSSNVALGLYQIKLLYSQSSKTLLKMQGRRPYRLVRIYVHSITPDPTDPVALGLFADRLPVGEGIYVELYS